MASSSTPQDPWKWLGLLQWSLKYSDGTNPSQLSPMSPEDKAFLELVMKEGIINEGDRMKEILIQVTNILEGWKEKPSTLDETQHVNQMLQELRDIVEQIDYARAFAAMKGLQFLIGCVQQEDSLIPVTTKILSLGILSTMSQSNPPIQKQLLEMGAIADLSNVFFQSTNDEIKARAVQAISAAVRSHELAESVFCQLEQSAALLESGLSSQSLGLRRRTLFLLNALVTSDTSDRSRIRRFQRAIDLVLTCELSPGNDLCEMALGMVRQMLVQKIAVNPVLHRKNEICAWGVQRIASIRKLSGEEREVASMELEEWEHILVLLARAEPDEVNDSNASEAPLLLDSPPVPETYSQ